MEWNVRLNSGNTSNDPETATKEKDMGDIEALDTQPQKERILEEIAARFESWAVDVLKDEESPQGLDAGILNRVLEGTEAGEENQTDAYTLWAALTALTQEIKLQGRTFKQLHDALAPFIDASSNWNESIRHHSENLAAAGGIVEQLNQFKASREREIQAEAERRVRREMLGVLLDMRDRLVRGKETVQTDADGFEPSWIDRLFGRTEAIERHTAANAARKKGYQLSLERLEDALASYGVREILCQGRTFDPRSMNVVDVEETADHPEGQVMEVYQTGYEWNGEVFRTAQVKVARRPNDPELEA